MMITESHYDLLTRIRNGQLRGLAKISSPNFESLRASVCSTMFQAEGFIRG